MLSLQASVIFILNEVVCLMLSSVIDNIAEVETLYQRNRHCIFRDMNGERHLKSVVHKNLSRPAHKHKQIGLFFRPRKITSGCDRKCLSPFYDLDLPLQLKKGIN